MQKVVQIGVHRSASSYRKQLKSRGYRTTCDEYLDMIPYCQEETELTLVRLTPCMLGIKEGGSYLLITLIAREFGFSLCPAEVGPALALQEFDSPSNDLDRIAMVPLVNPLKEYLGCSYTILALNHQRNKERWLVPVNGDPESVWGADAHFVFVKSS